MLQETKKERFPELDSCSFDKGFYSQTNRKGLKNIFNNVILPKKEDYLFVGWYYS